MDDRTNGKNRRKGWIARMRAAPPYVSVPLGVFFVFGSFLSFLPVFGLWMLPLGLWILAPNVPLADRMARRMLKWSIRNGFVRVKRVERPEDQERSSPSDD
ncbi:hypothetical protein [Methylocystis sp. ATCC 49242]|uniref:hypothetical protein n=1 Tax=Methylocystis sp. ATCC 49242 TaxID=622637 RepID=UPI0001F867CA|nr:hypothetical protein [Methylocystis sp. ATCC 49242]